MFDTLVYLVEHAGAPLDKDVMLRSIWPGVVVEENSLTQNISTLRQVLGETRGENRYIATIPRKGYRFVAKVTRRDDAGRAAAGDAPAFPLAAPALRADGRRLRAVAALIASFARSLVPHAGAPAAPAPARAWPFFPSSRFCLPSETNRSSWA